MIVRIGNVQAILGIYRDSEGLAEKGVLSDPVRISAGPIERTVSRYLRRGSCDGRNFPVRSNRRKLADSVIVSVRHVENTSAVGYNPDRLKERSVGPYAVRMAQTADPLTGSRDRCHHPPPCPRCQFADEVVCNLAHVKAAGRVNREPDWKIEKGVCSDAIEITPDAVSSRNGADGAVGRHPPDQAIEGVCDKNVAGAVGRHAGWQVEYCVRARSISVARNRIREALREAEVCVLLDRSRQGREGVGGVINLRGERQGEMRGQQQQTTRPQESESD